MCAKRMISKGSTLWVNQRRKSISGGVYRDILSILDWVRKVRCRAKLLEREENSKVDIGTGFKDVEWQGQSGAIFIPGPGWKLLNPPFSSLFLFLAIFLSCASWTLE